MKSIDESPIKTVLLKGKFHFQPSKNSKFKKPISKGFRPVAWIDDIKNGATSCSFVSDVIIEVGEIKDIEIVLLNELQLKEDIVKGVKVCIGSTTEKIGYFIVIENLGQWEEGKVP